MAIRAAGLNGLKVQGSEYLPSFCIIERLNFMLLTITPFVADGVANDWQKAVACLERTLGSILGNPERDLRAMVICQDRPPLTLKDDRFLFLETKQPKPNKQDPMAKERDKGAKTVEAFDAARELSPEYVMLVDGDDLISNTLASYVYQRPTFDAFCLKRGYKWREGSSHFTLLPGFNQICESAFVWRFDKRLFPAYLGKTYTKRICDQEHNLVEAAMNAEGLQVDKIYEPKAVYVTGHVNHIHPSLHKFTLKRRIKHFVLSPWRSHKLTPELKAEFGLTHEATKRSEC